MTSFFELIKRRESCRKYAQRPVEREKITACLEAARLSPSACNSQPWHYYVVNDVNLVSQIAGSVQGMGMNRFANDVPVFLVVTEEKVTLSGVVAKRFKGQEYAQLDIGLSVAYFTLAAAELGLGSCILGWYDEKMIKEILKLPAEAKLQLVLCLGYPKDESPRLKARKPLDEIVTWVESDK